MTARTIYLIAGEPSGDLLGGRLIAALKAQSSSDLRLEGIGGPNMTAQGLQSAFPMSELTVMGLTEVLPRIPNLLKRIRETADQIRSSKPDIVVTIDAPDFTLRVAKKLRGSGIKIVHYVAPSVWAWKPGRAKKLASLVNHLLTLLPFEPPYFEREGLSATFVGHSVIESKAASGDGTAFRKRHSVSTDDKLLCILPGSRHSETSHLLPVIKEAINHPTLGNYRLIIPTVETVEQLVQEQISQWSRSVTIVTGEAEKFDAFAASDAAIAASGTVSLELAMARLPYVTIYKFNAVTAFIGKRLVKTPYANIINILLEREAVPELIQENCSAEKIAAQIEPLLVDEKTRLEQIKSFDDAISQLQNGSETPSEKAARVVLELIQ